MNRLLNFPLLLLVFSFSSCIEFEREKLTYVHDEEKDELRVTLGTRVYLGISLRGRILRTDRMTSRPRTA